MIAMHRKSLYAGGFTLLELILALAITSLIGVVLAGTMRLAYRAWDRGESLAIENQELRFVHSHLLLEFKSAHATRGKMDERWMMAFDGARDQVFFLSTLGSLLSSSPDAGIREVGVYVDNDPSTDERGLVLWERPHAGGECFDQEGGRVIELDPAVVEVAFRYYYMAPQLWGEEEVEGEWVDSWRVETELESGGDMEEEEQLDLISRMARRSLPAAVEVTLTVETEDERGELTERVLPPVVAPVFGGTEVTWES